MLSAWQQQFPNCEPVSHWLREAFPDRWVRFHSLPGSKRYPENEDEYTIVLDRHNLVLRELTGLEQRVVLVTGVYSDTLEPPQRSERQQSAQLQMLDPTAKPWRIISMHEPEDPLFLHLFASEYVWHPGVFDSIIRMVANDMIENCMILPLNCHWLLHPYDGGMDIIMESSAKRDILKYSHSDWLSKEPSGL